MVSWRPQNHDQLAAKTRLIAHAGATRPTSRPDLDFSMFMVPWEAERLLSASDVTFLEVAVGFVKIKEVIARVKPEGPFSDLELATLSLACAKFDLRESLRIDVRRLQHRLS
jgi:hypothetical protein